MNQATINDDAEQALDKFMRNPLVMKIGVDKASFIAGFETCAEQRDELLAYAECEEAHRAALLPSNAGGTGNSQSYLEVFTKHGFRSNEQKETVYQFLDRLRRAAIAKAANSR